MISLLLYYQNLWFKGRRVAGVKGPVSILVLSDPLSAMILCGLKVDCATEGLGQ